MQRNRVLASVAASLLLFLTLGVAGLIASNVAIRKERDRAEALQTITEKQKQTAEANLQLARDAVDEWYVRFGEDWIEDAPGLTIDQRDLLEKAASFYARLSQDTNDTALQQDRASVLFKLGKLQRKLGEHRAAVASAEEAIRLVEPLIEVGSANLESCLLVSNSRQLLADIRNDKLDAKDEYVLRKQSLEDLDQVPLTQRDNYRFRFAWGLLHRRLFNSAWHNGGL